MVQLIMPKMGESVAEATILKWLKKEGDRIEADEPVLEIATDKVDTEVPSTTAGIMGKQLFAEGQVVKVGQVIATIITEEKASPTPPKEGLSGAQAINGQLKEKEISATLPKEEPVIASAPIGQTVIPPSGGGGAERFLSPLVRNIAKQEGITATELDTMKGSGLNDRITKHDILGYIEKRKTTASPTPPKEGLSFAQAPAQSAASVGAPSFGGQGGSTEIIEMDRMRKLIAEHMVMSKHTSPHVTSFVEADVTNLVAWRDKMKSVFEKRENEKLTFTPIFIEAVARAIKDFPMVNVSVDGTKIIVKKDINIGMATALPTGNLIVPVIRNADRLNMVGLTKTVNDLASRGRAGKLLPDDIQGGTFTVTNVGTFGNVMGTPIINQPQVAILATGAIRKKPAVIETAQGDFIGIRQMMFLSLSYDHRVVDGALGGSFLRRIADYLEQFDVNRGV